MKKVSRILITMFVAIISTSFLTASANSSYLNGTALNAIAQKNTEMRGVWVATVLNIDYPSISTTNSEALKSEAISILDNAKATGFNAVFLQVRPTSDALYKSQYFPWSKYLTGSQGTAPDSGFDPLEFWVTEAHKRGIELHTWINPYRITKNKAGEAKHDFASLSASNPARLHPEWVVSYSDGNLYYNPGIPEVRKLIIDSVIEIINNYNIDGIHFDDYFYPGKDFDDIAAFSVYGTAYTSIDDWRRENVNVLIRDLSQVIKASGKGVRFGISPFGIWANKNENALGSDTNGMQSYYDHYADTRKWVKEGIIDYITPQIYWNIGFSIADYSKLLYWWSDTVKGTGVDLYIGQASYRSGNSRPASAWYGVSEIDKQLKLNEQVEEVKGSIFYNYKSLAESPALSSVVKAIFEQRDGISAANPVQLSRPSGNISTSYKQYYLSGSSDPQKPLYLNGKIVDNRSEMGYFGVLVALEDGANIFTVSQEASYAACVIYKETSSSAPEKMKKAEIPLASVFPQNQEYRIAGEKITLSCKAPIGAKVTVKFGGKTYNMKPSATASYGSGIYSANYTYTYKIPAYKGIPRNVNLGKPVYTMKYNRIVKTLKAPASVGVIMKGSPYYGEVVKAVIDTYNTPSSSNGAAYELCSGMVDNITGMTGSYIRLSSGQWVKKADVKVYTLKYKRLPKMVKATYLAGDKWDRLQLDIKDVTAALASFDGTVLKMNISAALSETKPVLPENSLVSSIRITKSSDSTQYNLLIKETQQVEGFYIEKTSKGLVLNIKRHIKADTAYGALSGITIMVDPGHGGDESGAIGPAGLKYPEKTINLNTALKLRNDLEQMGAKVLMTRTSDVELSLGRRLALSRSAKPDMFISLHSDSAADNVDMSKITGFSAYYHVKIARALDEAIYNNVISKLSRGDRGIHVKNFYVMRGTWAPSMLLEGGFVPNPFEFEWLTSEDGQTQYAKSIADAIASYFAN